MWKEKGDILTVYNNQSLHCTWQVEEKIVVNCDAISEREG